MKNKSINVKEASFPDFSAGENTRREKTQDYTELLMNVPLTVRVEIGKAKLKMRDVLSLVQGSIIRLEKQAGAPVEVIANNATVARGDVIVIDDNFGVRITEIVSSKKFIKDVEKAAGSDSAKSEGMPVSPVSPAPSVQNAEETEVSETEYEEELSQPEENEE